MSSSRALAVVAASLSLLGLSAWLTVVSACATPIAITAEGEGEGATGEGEGDGRQPIGEGEGSVGEGEGEGEGNVGEGEGNVGEGEGNVGEGEGEGAVVTGCSTGHHWLLGDLGNALMHPGMACIECHATHSHAPTFAAAGTVMGALHDDDNCHGTASVTVTLTDAIGHVHTATTNSNGNFSFASGENIALPYTATITVGGQSRSMVTAQQSGDCMSCHTTLGAQAAPGRIVVPGVAIP